MKKKHTLAKIPDKALVKQKQALKKTPNKAASKKNILEQLLRMEDFGKWWFYKTNDDIKKYMHFFFADKLKPPRMYMVDPQDVILDDLELMVCLLKNVFLIPRKHVFKS